ncbi:rhodanese-like domain-containing protein [Synechocystis sp. PCC 7339]|uniref:rhodanese-like domain-containing protein n=1 Tax=unclassified Synechocystis TaxID=2640012 RepID=UPI001BB03B61|nr:MULTISPECIES: rhodanese-like domain-containing protein [unclassified Synechocystis]QUS59827.1 rhodanese-like domain-containing protein [Synechocystis sp. PCC 7338]UAJ72716.1 rhodanese-like domain-containing protein [Synechocystis sp. PCC 7339]
MQLIIVRCLTVFFLTFCLMGFNFQPTLAASLPPSFNSELSPQTETVDLAIEQFLNSLPANYYTIRTPAALKKQLGKAQIILVDVREVKEYQAGHIPGIINIPLRTLTHNLAQILPDSKVIVYCSTVYRSAMAIMTLNLLGYENVLGFPPSFTGWQAAGEVIVKT